MNNKTTRLICVFLLLILWTVPIFGNQSLKITVNGQNIDLGNWLVSDNGTSYIPAIVVSNLLNGEKLDLKTPTKNIYNTSFVPLKPAFETLGASVNWDKATNSIMITSDELSYNGQTIKELLQEPLPQGHVEIKISAAGDVVLGWDEKFSTQNRFDSVLKEKGYDYKYFFKNVKHIFETDDMTIVNLETPLTNATKKAEKTFTFKGKPEYAQILKEGSIESVNLANNHTYDYLTQGMKDTIATLSKANIEYFGDGNKSIKEVKGIKIGNLGYKGWSNASSVKSGIKKDIEHMKKTANLVIVSFHWGEEGVSYPNAIQKDLGKFCIDNGADLVIGHHPHVIQGIEEYKDKMIIYSLGNFSFGGNRNPTDKDTFIYQQSFIFNDQKQLISTTSGIIPCRVSSVDYRNDYCPTPQLGQGADRIINRLNTYSKGFQKPYQVY
ncbi:MAG TPA: CapA family protein [Epulopiscium sp.]|nr:CapA family protein [Candidatus Epulonipiscium sp.]